MASNIGERDKQQGVTMAWHGLTEVKPFIELNSNWLTDWEIVENPLFIKNEHGDDVKTEFKILTASDDNQTIGKPYSQTFKPIRNEEFLKIVEGIVSNRTDIKIESIGSVCDKGRIFVSLSLKDYKKNISGGREFENFINIGNGHDQSCAFWINNTSVCVVCNNTFNYNIGRENADFFYKFKHTANIQNKLAEVNNLVDDYLRAQKTFYDNFQAMADSKISEREAQTYLIGKFVNVDEEGLIIKSSLEKAMKVYNLFKSGDGNKGETYADLFSGFTDYYTHSGARIGKDIIGASRQYKQYVYSEFGNGALEKNKAYNEIINTSRFQTIMDRGNNIISKVPNLAVA